jgi:diguanylate cyclase (GGDEF)-like protein
MMDVQTIYLLNVSMTFVMSAVALYYWYHNRGLPGLRTWSSGLFVGGLGGILLSQRTPETIVLLSVLGGALTIAGYSLLWVAVRRFNGGAARIGQAALPVGLFLTLQAVLEGAGASDRMHVVVTPFVLGIVGGLIAWEVFRGAGPEGSGARLPTAVAFAGLSGAMALRVVSVLSGDLPGTEPLQNPPMRDITQLLVTVSLNAAMCGFLMMINDRLRSRIKRLAVCDDLTGVLNRRGFLEQAHKLCQDAQASRAPVAVLMMDLDNFSAINAAFGHEGGDRALVAFADLAREQLRSGDLIGRLGGEEFCAVLRGADEYTGGQVAERLRSSLAARIIEIDDKPLRLTVSIGLAQLGGRDLPSAMRAADGALYKAKDLGRNRVCDAPEPPVAATLRPI